MNKVNTPILFRLLAALLLGHVCQAQMPFLDDGPPPETETKKSDEPVKPNLLELMKDAKPVENWEQQWQVAPSEELNPLAQAGLKVATELSRADQVSQANDEKVGGSRADLLLTMDVARHELLKHAIQTAIKNANLELAKTGNKQIENVMVSNCSPLGNGTRDSDLTVQAEDDVREAALFRHLANYFDDMNKPLLNSKLSTLEKGQGRAFSVAGLDTSFHRGQNDVPPPHEAASLENFAIKYRRNIERQYENPEAYLGFGAEQEVQGRRGLRLAGKNPAQVLVQTFSVGTHGVPTYTAERYTNQKQALDALRTTLGPDYTRAHNAMHAFCDFVQAAHHENEVEQDISKGPLKYAERSMNAICRLHGFEEWSKLNENGRAQVLRLALGPGYGNEAKLIALSKTLTGVFGQKGQKVGDSVESVMAMKLLRRTAARALQEVARVMMDPPPIRPAETPLETWNGLNRQEQEQLARTNPEYQKRVSVAAMENLVIATRLLAQLDMHASHDGPASTLGTMALRRVIAESETNPRLQKVLQLAADHAQVDAAIERNCPKGMDIKEWAKQRKALVAKRSKLRYELSQECAAFADSPDRKAVETVMKAKPGETLKKSKLNLIPPELQALQAKRAQQTQIALGGDNPLPPLQRAAQFGKNAAGLAFSHMADPNNLPDILNLVEMVEDGAGAKDYARFMVRSVAGRYNAVVGYAVGVTEISMSKDAEEQERQLEEMGKGLVFDILSRYIPEMAQAKLFFDIEKGIVNVTYGYEIKSLNRDLVDALYMGEAGRIGQGRAGTLSGWVRDAVEPVLDEAYVVHFKDETGKEHVAVDTVRLYQDCFKNWTNRNYDDLGRITDLKYGFLNLVKAHDKVVTQLELRAEGLEPSWFSEYTYGLYVESDLDEALRNFMTLMDPMVREMVNTALNSVPNLRQYKEKRADKTVDAIEEGLVGRLSGDIVSGLQSDWTTQFMKQRQLRKNLDGLMSTAVTSSIAEELAKPVFRIVSGKALPGFELEVHARTPDQGLQWEFNGNLPLPLICKLKAAGEMPDDVPKVKISILTEDLVKVPDTYRPYKDTPAGNLSKTEAAKDPSLYANGVFKQRLTVQATNQRTGDLLAEKKVELYVRFSPEASFRLEPNALQGLTNQVLNFNVAGSALPYRPRFSWDMGNGIQQTSYEPKLDYAYPKEGSFTIKVTLYDGGQVYLGGKKAPVLATAVGTARIEKDLRLKHSISYFDNEQTRPANEYWYREDDSSGRTLWMKEGEERRWYENGNLAGLMTYKNNVLEGRMEMYYENGKPKLITVAKNGKAEGAVMEYHENGQKSSQGNASNDLKTGTWTYWGTDGVIGKIENYNNKGQRHGQWKSWCSLASGGQFLSEVVDYENDESVHVVGYRPDGSIERDWRK